MRRAQADRSVIAARASRRVGARRSTGRPATDVAARPITPLTPIGSVRRSSAVKMTGAQRNSEGRRSEWNATPYLRDAVTTDAKWSRTLREIR